MEKKYSLGLDIGTESLGWAVVDEDNKLVRKKGFTLWGVRMFSAAKDASERRSFRSSRRRIKRRKERIELLRQIFEREIALIDPHFFERLNDSFFKIEDKRNKNYYNLFNDGYTDKEYFEQFPTIYHLRKYILEHDEKIDIRMLYLALHHMIKYRGNFLLSSEVDNKNDSTTIAEYFKELNEILNTLIEQNEDDEEYYEPIDYEQDAFFINLEEIINGDYTKNDKKLKLTELFKVQEKTLVKQFIIPLLIGSKVNISKLDVTKEFGYEKLDIDLTDEKLKEDIDSKRANYKDFDTLFDLIPILISITGVYYVKKFIGNHRYISQSMVEIYENHQKDLRKLKKFIKKYIPSSYDECFKKYDEKLNNYARYIGMNSTNGEMKRFAHCSRIDFYTYLKKLLNNINDEDAIAEKEDFLNKIEKTDFLLRQNSNLNGIIPMQFNLNEMQEMLDKQAKYYSFLSSTDGDNLSVKEKIIEIFKFKIPYYVGPLNCNAKNFWAKRENEKIYPWNFASVVDLEESAKTFIERMQRKCSYLKGENDICLPKHSLLFSEYNCLQYLNRLQINGSLITNQQKQELFENIFLKIKNPTKKHVTEYLTTNYGYVAPKAKEKGEIPEVTCNMASYIKFKEIYGDDFDQNKEQIEQIIKDIVVFEDKKILEKRLKNLYLLDDKKIKEIKNLNYQGYSNLSYKLLNGLVSENPETGEIFGPIIEIMRTTNLNLQQIIFASNYKFNEAIDKYNKKQIGETEEEKIEEFIDKYIYVSPVMKRPLLQAYKLIEEVEKILGQPIDKYYVECARFVGKKKPTASRYNQLIDLYKNCEKIAADYNVDLKQLKSKLDASKDKLRSDKIYLYFTQLGKCMYTLENLDFGQLSNNHLYDIDHIYPQSIIKDDSISNRVLVKKTKNNDKSDEFIFNIDNFLPNNAKGFYEKLLNLKLITKEKFLRLTKKELTPDELNKFVNRQLVVTNQAVKGLIETLKLYKKVEPQKIIYSKAENISSFRKNYELYKSRTANNYHHAHDAYLNVVVGRALHEYYTINNFINSRDLIRIKGEKKTINPDIILKYDRKIKDRYIWKKDETLKIIRAVLYNRYDVNETIRTYKGNEMFNKVSIKKAGTKSAIPAKTVDARADVTKYGGIDSHSFCKYVIVKTVEKKGAEKFTLEAIPKMYENDIDKYLEESNYKNYQIVCSDIRTNVIVEDGNLRFCITGKTNDRYCIKNMKDRNFNEHAIKIIHSLDKYNENSKNKVDMKVEEDKVTVSPAKNAFTKEIVITKADMNYLYVKLKEMYNKKIYEYSVIKKISKSLPDNIANFSIEEIIKLCSELLILLKTNERSTANLKLINLSSETGSLNISKNLVSGMKFIYESFTGYYKQVLYEVPKSGI